MWRHQLGGVDRCTRGGGRGSDCGGVSLAMQATALARNGEVVSPTKDASSGRWRLMRQRRVWWRQYWRCRGIGQAVGIAAPEGEVGELISTLRRCRVGNVDRTASWGGDIDAAEASGGRWDPYTSGGGRGSGGDRCASRGGGELVSTLWRRRVGNVDCTTSWGGNINTAEASGGGGTAAPAGQAGKMVLTLRRRRVGGGEHSASGGGGGGDIDDAKASDWRWGRWGRRRQLSGDDR